MRFRNSETNRNSSDQEKNLFFFFLRFQQHEKRNELINLINLPWKRGFIKISIYCRFYSFVTFFHSLNENKKREWDNGDFNIRVSGFQESSTYFSTFHISYHLNTCWLFFHSSCNISLRSVFSGSDAEEKFVAKMWNEIKLNFLFSTDFQFSIFVHF